jgi:hypothetical protein
VSQPLKVADALMDAARTAAAENHRSMAAQIEHWAVLGRAIEQVLITADIVALKRSEGRLDEAQRAELLRVLAHDFEPNRQEMTRAAIAAHDTVRYETDRAMPSLLIQRLPDGQRRVGRMINREFVAVELSSERSASAAG